MREKALGVAREALGRVDKIGVMYSDDVYTLVSGRNFDTCATREDRDAPSQDAVIWSIRSAV